MITDPNALYAAAYKAANVPSVTNVLGPIAKPYLDAGVKALGTLAAEELESLTSAVEEELSELAPEVAQAASELVSEVASGVSSIADEIPAIGMVINDIALIVQASQPSPVDLAKYAAEAHEALSEPVLGTGPGNIVTPADIFEPDPTATGGYYSGFNYPRSSLGRFLVAVTEADEDYPITKDNDTNLQNLENDAPLRHTGAGYHTVAAKVTPGAGIPVDTRRVLASLRRAMASQNTDKGSALWPIYLSVLSDARKKGQLTEGFATSIPSFYWRAPTVFGAYGGDFGVVTDEPHGSNPEGDGSPGPYAGPAAWAPYAKQLWAILDAWDGKQSTPLAKKAVPHIHIDLKKPAPALRPSMVFVQSLAASRAAKSSSSSSSGAGVVIFGGLALGLLALKR